MVDRDDFGPLVIFIFFGLIVGALVESIMRQITIPFPYVIIIFYIGIIFGSLTHVFDYGQRSILEVSNASADVMVYGFLPALLFSETMTLNWHHLRQTFSQSVLLAGPGGVLVCFLLGILAKFCLPFNWTWDYCLLFGAILCATDPVSVVNLLKSTKASAKLTMTISGESLLNDGSAMILFLFFYDIINGKTFTLPTFLAFCAQKVFLSPVIGFVIGGITARLMRRIYTPNNPRFDIQILLSVICGYLSFGLMQGYLEGSGVLCCCAAGITVSLFAPLPILSDSRFHYVWEYAEWGCNTLIFLMAGFIGASRTASAITPKNIGYLILFYIFLIYTRGLMVFMLKPLLNKSGKPFSNYECIFTTYAGLRGALGIALALEAANNANGKGTADVVGNQLFFMVAGLASLTLLINGSTAGLLLLKLQLVDDPNAPVSKQLEQVLRRIKRFMKKWLTKELLQIKSQLGTYDEKELMQLCNMMSPELGKSMTFVISAEDTRQSSDHEISVALDGLLDEDDSQFLSVRVSGSMVVDNDTLTYARTTFLQVVRARYMDSIHNGKIGSSSTSSKLLLHSVDIAMDTVDEGLADLNAIVSFLHPNPRWLRTVNCVDSIFRFCRIYTGFLSRYRAYKERIIMYVLSNYIDAHEYAQSRMHFFLGSDNSDASENENNIAAPEEQKVLGESKYLVSEAKVLLGQMVQSRDLLTLNTHRAARAILQKQEEIMNSIVEEGILSEKNAKQLYDRHEMERARLNIEQASKHKLMVKRNIKEKIESEKKMAGTYFDAFAPLSLFMSRGIVGSASNSSDDLGDSGRTSKTASIKLLQWLASNPSQTVDGESSGKIKELVGVVSPMVTIDGTDEEKATRASDD